MAMFRPCIGCTQRVGCDIKLGVIKALKGQPVSSVRLKCDLPFTQHFPPGTRVKVQVWDHRDPHYGGEPKSLMVPSTVICRSTKKRDKLLMLLDEKIMFADESETEFCTAYPKDVERLDEPPGGVCAECGRGLVHGKCGCWDKIDEDPFSF